MSDENQTSPTSFHEVLGGAEEIEYALYDYTSETGEHGDLVIFSSRSGPFAMSESADSPAPTKPFGEAVADSYRGIKDWFNGPETSQKTDKSVREHVNAELDKQIDKHDKSKPFPGII